MERPPISAILQKIEEVLATTPDYLLGRQETSKDTGNPVDLGTILAGTALTATAVIGIVALAKAMGKLSEKDRDHIQDILGRE